MLALVADSDDIFCVIRSASLTEDSDRLIGLDALLLKASENWYQTIRGANGCDVVVHGI